MGEFGMNSVMNPEEIVAMLGVRSGMVVADFGCGSGYFSVAFAKAVGSDGSVHSLDVLKESIEATEGRAKAAGLRNVFAKRVNLEKPGGAKLSDNSVEMVFMKDILFQSPSKAGMMSEAARVLLPEGLLILIDWNVDAPFGPDSSLRVSAGEARNMIQKAGLQVISEEAVLGHHYLIRAKK